MRWLLALSLYVTGCASITPHRIPVCVDPPRHGNWTVGATDCDLYFTQPGGVLYDPVDHKRYRWVMTRGWGGARNWDLVEVRP